MRGCAARAERECFELHDEKRLELAASFVITRTKRRISRLWAKLIMFFLKNHGVSEKEQEARITWLPFENV
jgi:hypothetical protein